MDKILFCFLVVYSSVKLLTHCKTLQWNALLADFITRLTIPPGWDLPEDSQIPHLGGM